MSEKQKLSYVDICCTVCSNYQMIERKSDVYEDRIETKMGCVNDIPVHLCYIKYLESKLTEAESIFHIIKGYGTCVIDNGINGGLCIGKNCSREWCSCESRKIVSFNKYKLDCAEEIEKS